MKKFLLIAGCNYYPEAYTGDWKGCFATREEAESHITVEETPILYTSGKKINQVKEIHKSFLLDGHPVDWYDIVNLEEWMNK